MGIIDSLKNLLGVTPPVTEDTSIINANPTDDEYDLFASYENDVPSGPDGDDRIGGKT